MVDWKKKVSKSVTLLRGWIKKLKINADKKVPLAVFVYTRTVLDELDCLKASLEREAPKETMIFKPPKVMEVLTPAMKDDLWRSFSEKLKEAGIDPGEYRGRFEALLEPTMGYEDNLAVLMDEAKLIILGEKHPQLRVKYQLSLMDKLVKAREKVDWPTINESIAVLGYLVELMGDAVKAEDVVGFYRLAKRMEGACEALVSHIGMVAPEIVEVAERFKRIPYSTSDRY